MSAADAGTWRDNRRCRARTSTTLPESLPPVLVSIWLFDFLEDPSNIRYAEGYELHDLVNTLGRLRRASAVSFAASSTPRLRSGRWGSGWTMDSSSTAPAPRFLISARARGARASSAPRASTVACAPDRTAASCATSMRTGTFGTPTCFAVRAAANNSSARATSASPVPFRAPASTRASTTTRASRSRPSSGFRACSTR